MAWNLVKHSDFMFTSKGAWYWKSLRCTSYSDGHEGIWSC